MNPLNDTFEVHEELGQGGFGTVYRATRRATGEEVALKRLKPRPELGEEHSQQLFLNGARLAKKFDLEGFVKILEVDVEPFSGPFIVMELLRGETLYQRLCTRPLAAVEALEVLFDIATIVSRAHKRGVVHRDLKPSNIMLCKDGLCKDGVRVLDLGMATLVAEARTKSFETLSSTPSSTNRCNQALAWLFDTFNSAATSASVFGVSSFSSSALTFANSSSAGVEGDGAVERTVCVTGAGVSFWAAYSGVCSLAVARDNCSWFGISLSA